MKRRELLGAGTGAALVGLSGCVATVANATTRTGSGPAATYLSGGQVPTTFDFGLPSVETTSITKAALTVSGNVAGLSGSVDIDGWFTTSQFRSKNYHSTRSNDPDSESASGSGDCNDHDDTVWDDCAVAAYLDGEAVIGEGFLLSLPNAKPPGGGEPMTEFAPDQLLDAVTAGDDSGGGGGSTSAAVKFKPGAELSDTVKLTAVGTPVRNVTVHKEIDEASPKIYDGLTTGGGGDGLPGQWQQARTLKGGTISQTILGAAVVSVGGVDGAAVDLPALLHMKRIRHGEDYLFVGGWVLDAGRIYSDAATLLVEAGPNEVVGLGDDEIGSADDALLTGRLTRERSRLGGLVYDGPATDDLLPFLPPALREGDGLERFGTASKRSARKGRNPQTGKEIKIPAKRVATTGTTVAAIQTRADRCGLESCGTVGEHAGARKSHIERAQSALEDGDDAAAREELLAVREIVAGDIEVLVGVEDRQAVGDLLGLERAVRRETALALDPLDRDVDGDGFDESDGEGNDVEETELAVEKIERGIAGDDDGDGIWDAIDGSAVAGAVSSDKLLVAGGVVGTAHTFELKEGRKGMNAVNVQRTRTAGGDADDPPQVRYWSVFGSGDDHRVVVMVVTDAEGRAMNKAELIDAIASEADITKADARRSLDAFIDTTTKLHAGIEKDQVKRGMVTGKAGPSGGAGGSVDPVVPLVDGPAGDDETPLKTTVVPLDAPLVHLTASTRALKKGDRVALVGFGSYAGE